MKLGLVTKLDKRNKTTSKNFDNDVTLANCDVIVIFLISCQFGAIWKPDSGCIVCINNKNAIPSKYMLVFDIHIKTRCVEWLK